MLRDAARGEAIDHAQGTRFGIALAAVRPAAVAVSVPIWTAAGLVGP